MKKFLCLFLLVMPLVASANCDDWKGNFVNGELRFSLKDHPEYDFQFNISDFSKDATEKYTENWYKWMIALQEKDNAKIIEKTDDYTFLENESNNGYIVIFKPKKTDDGKYKKLYYFLANKNTYYKIKETCEESLKL